MFKNVLWMGLALSMLGLVSVSTAKADEWDKKTILTFSQAVEIPGHVLPAGTYMFKLNDMKGDRHIVQVFNADGTKIIATVLAIPNSRLKATDETFIRFGETPAGEPEAIRAWFYPGNTVGQEFVYPRHRARILAKASKSPVPAIDADDATEDQLNTSTLVAVTPDDQEAPIAAVQTTSPQREARVQSDDGRRMPKTASALPLIVLLGLGSIGAAFGLMAFGKYTTSV